MKKSSETFVAKNVDEYLAQFPADVQAALNKLRQSIRGAAPKAEEVISYQIPGYKYFGHLVFFAAFKNHCSFFVVEKNVFKTFEEDLKPFHISGTTVHFTPDHTLPTLLVKKIVKLRMADNEARAQLKKEQAVAKKAAVSKTTDDEKVNRFMDALQHPLKKEMEAIRKIIKTSNKGISERIKWNAPSYYCKEDFLTFNPRATNHVHLVFHHPAIIDIQSDLLEGSYRDRRMMYFKNMKEVVSRKKELQRIINELVIKIGEQNNAKERTV